MAELAYERAELVTPARVTLLRTVRNKGRKQALGASRGRTYPPPPIEAQTGAQGRREAILNASRAAKRAQQERRRSDRPSQRLVKPADIWPFSADSAIAIIAHADRLRFLVVGA